MRSSPSDRERTCTVDPPGIRASEMEREAVVRQGSQAPFDLLLLCNGCDRTIGAWPDGTVKKREYSTSQCPFAFLLMLGLGLGEQETLTEAALDEAFDLRFVFPIFVVFSEIFGANVRERESGNCQESKICCAGTYSVVRVFCCFKITQ